MNAPVCVCAYVFVQPYLYVYERQCLCVRERDVCASVWDVRITLCYNTRWSSLIYPIIRKHSSYGQHGKKVPLALYQHLLYHNTIGIALYHEASPAVINFNILPTINGVPSEKNDQKNSFHFFVLLKLFIRSSYACIQKKYLSVMPSNRVKSI